MPLLGGITVTRSYAKSLSGLCNPIRGPPFEGCYSPILSTRTFADSCVFPDHPRRRASEHFINLPRDSNGLTSDQCTRADKCVLTAILNDSKVLSSRAENDTDRLVALKSLGHWVGDIHQPLQVSFEDDRGGNSIRVNGQCSGNLHATWITVSF